MTGVRRRATIALLCCALGAPGTVAAQPPSASARPQLRNQLRNPYQPVRMTADAAPDAPLAAAMRVAVVGSVKSPATYAFAARPTAADVLAAAGGLTPDAGDNLLIVREGRILGPLLLTPNDRTLTAAGPLFDNDVLVFKARRGVRTALYQTSEPSAVERRGVENAMSARAVHVACLGLADYPVVLPLAERQATEQVLLLELLGLSPATAERSVRRVSDGTYAADDGVLHDGTVLSFDRQVMGPNGFRTTLPLPVPRETTTPVAPAVVPEPVPAPIGSVQLTAPPQPLRIAADGQRLAEPLPGFPFVVHGDSLPAIATPSGAVFQSAPVLRGVDAVDVSTSLSGARPTARSTPSQSLLTSAEYLSVSPGEPIAPRSAGIRAPVVARGPQPPHSVEPTLVGDEPSVASPPSPGSALESPVDLSILGGVLLAAACCLGASYVWAREEKRRSAAPVRVSSTSVVDSNGGALLPAATTAPSSTLQGLLDNEIPIIEEPIVTSRPPRMFGPVVGQRRLMIDAPHAQVAAPHFALSRAASDQRRQQRYARHLSAVSAVTSRPPAQRSVSEAAAPAPTFRYDVVEPESPPSAPPPRRPRAEQPPGELLTRVLNSLSGEG